MISKLPNFTGWFLAGISFGCIPSSFIQYSHGHEIVGVAFSIAGIVVAIIGVLVSPYLDNKGVDVVA